MDSSTLPNSIEDKLHAATRMPQPRPEFIAQLRNRLMAEPRHAVVIPQPQRMLFRRPVWVIAIIIIFLTAALIAIGPQRVLAAFRQLFGYIPGVGIVNQSAPIRVLAEPVSMTRAGVTISINSAVLTTDSTRIDFGISGVPLSAYPSSESVSGCNQAEYLRLPDGTKVDIDAVIPTNVSEATLVLPCIFNTMPGKVPQDWELSMRFVPAPPDMTVLPVIELTPSLLQTSPAPATTHVGGTATPAQSLVPWITIDQLVETSDGYILIGAFRPQITNGGWAQVDASAQPYGVPQILDATGRKVDYTVLPGINLSSPFIPPGGLSNGGFQFAFQIKALGLAFPLTLRYTGEIYSPVEPPVTAEVAFDAGPNPQPGQVWTLNQDVHMGAYTVRLISITAVDSGYSFQIDPGAGVTTPDVQIEGYQPVAGGGGSGGESLVYSQIPKGKLELLFSNLFVVTDTRTWETTWQPEKIRTDWPTPTTALNPVCLNTETLNQLKPPPADFHGRVLLTASNSNLDLVLANLDGSQRQVVVPNGYQGTLSPDGQHLAYANHGITVLDISSGKTTAVKGGGGEILDLHWSPDGTRLAYVTAGDIDGIFVVSVDGSTQRQYTNLGYESIAGWSPDGTRLYYAIPDSKGEGWLLRAIDVASGEIQDLFVLDNSSRKAPMPALSPDGQWIAYRGVDNVSLYLIRMDGTQDHVLVEDPSNANAISGIVWSPDGSWLGVSLVTPGTQNGEVILMQPQGCQAYNLPSLNGDVDGLLIP